MVKPSKPASPQPSEPAPEAEDFSRAHPLMRGITQVEEMLDRHAKLKERDDFQIKELEQWKAVVNAVASSKDGRMLLRSMLQYSGVLNPPSLANPNKMVTNAIKGAFYLTWIRPYLKPDVRKELE